MQQAPGEAIIPRGVTLRDPEDQDTLRASIYGKVEEAFGQVFPQSYGGVRLELNDLHWVDPDLVSIADQQNALNQRKFLARRLRGTFRLIDEESGAVLDEQQKTVIRAPMLTERGTFIHNGNEYFTVAQSRLLPGAYVRRKESGEVEAQVNPRQGTGAAFRVQMEPETGVLRLNMRKSNLKLYPLLRGMGVDDEEIRMRWGNQLWQANKAADDAKVFPRAYQALVRKPDESAGPETKAEALREVFRKLMLHRDTVRFTMPSIGNRTKLAAQTRSGFQDYGVSDADVGLGIEGLLDVTDKVIRVGRGEADTDERDSLAYKRFYAVDDLLKERILLDHGKLRLKTLRQLARMRNLGALRVHHFEPYVDQLIVKSALSSPPEEINPLHLREQQRRFTAMGEGGIRSEDAITPEAQNVSPSHFGFVDVLAGPESSRAGIDSRLATGVRLGSDGRPYQQFLNRKTGNYEWLNPSDLVGKVLAVPQ